ncbi:MAG: 30S ribosomal protein S3 [Candidatus Micrarchaeia archaeon]|jgi:small subunit ribosomal protein S3
MGIERKFINKAISDHKVRAFIRKEMDRAGVSQVMLQKTPMATRIIIYVRRPGVVVGKKGSSIKDLCEKLTTRFGVDNPQLDVIEVEKPSLDATLMAEKIGRQIEIRGNIKQIMRMGLKEIMEAGAVGAEIRLAGKVVGKGGKAKAMKIYAGHLKKSGEPVFLIPEGRYVCYLKAGTIGVQVKIAAPNVKYPDAYDMKALDAKLLAVIEPVAEAAAEVAAAPSEDAELEKKIDEKIESAKKPAKKEEKPASKKDEKKKPEKQADARKPAKKDEKKKPEPKQEKPADVKAEKPEEKSDAKPEKAAEAKE